MMTPTTKPKLSLLIVDDEPNVVEALSQLFDMDYAVFTATNGAEALETVKRLPEVAIVISDQRMPGMSGVELLKHIRQLYPDSMRILLTGYADLDAVLESVNVGEVFRYIRKPWQTETLRSIIALASASYVLRKQKQPRTLPRIAAPDKPLQPVQPIQPDKPVQPTQLTVAEILSALSNNAAKKAQADAEHLEAEAEKTRLEATRLETLRLEKARLEAARLEEVRLEAERRKREEEIIFYNSRRKSDTPEKYASFEEEFLASVPPETREAAEVAIEEIKRYESFEEEFYATVSEATAMPLDSLPLETGSALETSAADLDKAASLMNTEREERDGRLNHFSKAFAGRSGKPRILVIDDSRRVVSSLFTMLSGEFEAVVAFSFEAGLDLLEDTAFIAVVLSDAPLSGMSLTLFLSETNRIAPMLPTVVLGERGETVLLVSVGIGVFRKLSPPWDASLLRQMLHEAVDECRIRLEHGLFLLPDNKLR